MVKADPFGPPIMDHPPSATITDRDPFSVAEWGEGEESGEISVSEQLSGLDSTLASQ
jgi:hypothetical protein